MPQIITVQQYMEDMQAEGMLFKSLQGDMLTLDSYGSIAIDTEEEYKALNLGDIKDRIRMLNISTNDVDRKKDKLDPSGVILDNFKRNPLFLLEHGFSNAGPLTDHKKILGRINSVEIHEDKIVAEAMFVTTPSNPIPAQILDLELKGLMPANSIGWRPVDNITIDDNGIRTVGKWELIEVSKVMVPVNGKATNLQVSH